LERTEQSFSAPLRESIRGEPSGQGDCRRPDKGKRQRQTRETLDAALWAVRAYSFETGEGFSREILKRQIPILSSSDLELVVWRARDATSSFATGARTEAAVR